MQTQDREFAQRIKTWGSRTLDFVNKINILFPGNFRAEGVYKDLMFSVQLGTGEWETVKTNSHRRQALSGTPALVQGSCSEPGRSGSGDRGQQPGARRGSKGLPWGRPRPLLLRSAPPSSREAWDSVYLGASRTTCILKALGRSWALSQHRRCTRCLTAGHLPGHLAALQVTGPNWEERRAEVGRLVG